MKIIVTGAAGFIGSHIVDHLIKKGHKVVSVDDLSGGFLRNIHPKSTFIRLDLRHKDKTIDLIKKIKPRLIYHLAADATEGRSQFTPISATERNYNAYLHVLLGAIKAKTKKIVLTSSMSVYGEQKPPFNEKLPLKPTDIYGIAKAAMEQATHVLGAVYNISYTILRPHNVYGPRQNLEDPYRNVIGIFINRMLMGKHFYIYGDGRQKRSFSFIDDVAPYIVRAGFIKNTNNEIINIGPQQHATILEVAHEVLSHFVDNPQNPPLKFKPSFLPLRPQEVVNATCTDEKAKRLLGFRQKVPLNIGIARMVAWVKTIGPQPFKYLDTLELNNEKLPLTWKNKLL